MVVNKFQFPRFSAGFAGCRAALVAVVVLAAAFPMWMAGQLLPGTDTATGIFNENYRTLTAIVDSNPLAPPVLTLNSSDEIEIAFDGLGEDREYLRYSLYHCNYDWTPSVLIDNELFDGFNFADITDYAFSRGTTVHYVHYRITLPNPEFSFRVSGNYLLRVYPESDPDDILLQVRLMVSEGAVSINGAVSSRTDVGFNTEYQQLEVEVDTDRYPVRDLFNDLRLTVCQNNRPDTRRTIPHPSRVSGSRAFYEHLRALIFPGGNEYRRMETVQLTYPTMGVEATDYQHPYYHHYLHQEGPRAAKPYYYDSTQNGRFVVREYNSSASDTEADYSIVHFNLRMLQVPDGDLYLDGDLTQRRLDGSSRLDYDPQTGSYHKALLLKQGAYNYQYLFFPTPAASLSGSPTAAPSNSPGASSSPAPPSVTVPGAFAPGSKSPGSPSPASPQAAAASTAAVEGNFYQTVNEYFVAVYYRNPAERFDRLLAYTLLFSGR